MFSVSAQDYLSILKEDETDVFTEEEETGIPQLQRHIHTTINNHNEAKVKEYVGPFFFSLSLSTFLRYRSFTVAMTH